MTKIKVHLISFLLFFAIIIAFIGVNNGRIVKAEDLEEQSSGEVVLNEDSTPYLLTSLSLTINGGNGEIWATVRNDFTLFPTTVMVIIELYSSVTYKESHEDMTLVNIASSLDLNIYKSISVSYPTEGIQQYWQARMRYKIDSDPWKERNTGTLLFDANGNFLDII